MLVQLPAVPFASVIRYHMVGPTPISVLTFRPDGGSPASAIVNENVRSLEWESRISAWPISGAEVSGSGATFATL